jgi:hypothetical protein
MNALLQAGFPHVRKADNYPLAAKAVANGSHKATKHNMSIYLYRGKLIHPTKIL